MRKKLLLALVGIVLACCLGATVSAFAGITTNSPVGDGMLSNGELNATNFMIMDDEEDSSYEIKATDFSVLYNNGEWQEMLVGTPVPKETMAKENVKVSLVYKINQLNASAVQLKIIPAAHSLDEKNTYGYVLTGSDNGLAIVGGERTSAQTSDPKSQLIAHHANNTVFDLTATGIQWQAYSWSGDGLKGNIASYGAAYFLIEMTVNENDWVDVRLVRGVMESDGSMTWIANGATVTNWAPYDGSYDFYTNVWARYADGMGIEGATLSVSYTEGGETKTETLFDTNMDDAEKVIVAADGEAKAGCYIARGLTYTTLSDDVNIVVTNPGQDTRIVTLNPLKVDTTMAETFRMTAAFSLQQIAATRKVGIAFGLNSYSAALSAPAEGASFLYFSVDEDGNVVLGADNIASDGTATAAGTVQTLAEVNLGDIVSLSIVGKQDNSIDVTVGGNTFNFPGLKLSGNLAFAQTGTGDVTYTIIPSEFDITAYSFVENEATEAVTTNFDGNYLSSVKFSMQSKVAPSEYIKKQEGTTHEISGLVVEDQKLGFYGTSTNTRVMFQQQYADFVLQFDYISEPFAHRAMPGGLETAGAANRYSPFYILFGADNNMPELAQAYALGIIEGNATQYFWGAESLVTRGGKLGDGSVKVLATLAEVEQSEEAIPWYTIADGKVQPLSKYGMPNEEDSNYVYSFYNKTSRVKMVVVNNSMALYAAEVDESGNAGEYVKLYEQKVSNAAGYVGFGTDAPGWATLDNIAITPIARETALSLGLEADPAVDLAADVDPADMDTDPEPTPIAKAELTVDKEGKKVTWKAVTGAKEYEVTVKLNNEEKLSTTVTGTEVDLSSLTEAGEYEVAVVVVPEDEAIYLRSRATVKYTVESGTGGGDDNPVNPGGDEDKGCGRSIAAVGGLLAAAALGGAAIFLKKRKENE